MSPYEPVRVESEAMVDFSRTLPAGFFSDCKVRNNHNARVNLEPENVKNGLGKLVLTLVKLLHELLERQAIRRIESGSLSEAQIEKLGLTLMRQAETLEDLRKEFGLGEEDLNLDLGPLGRLL